MPSRVVKEGEISINENLFKLAKPVQFFLASQQPGKISTGEPSDETNPLASAVTWKDLRGGIGVNSEAPQPDQGLMANFNMKSLDLDAWGRLASSITGSGRQSAAANRSDAPEIAQYVDPEFLAAHAAELIVLGKKLDNVVVGASHQSGVWQANIDSAQASGYLTWNESPSGRGLGRVSARLASLIIPKSATSDVTELLEGKNESTQIPGLPIVRSHPKWPISE